MTWFPELVDKRMFCNSMCNGVLSVLFREEYNEGASLLGYEAIYNGDGIKLRSLIANIAMHYQVMQCITT